MSNPKFSVIVPTYKTAKYLPRCIDSILNQSFQDFEIIIVSDGPQEDHKIAEDYAQKDNRITVLKEIKKGLGGARNTALKIAQGKYIWFVDSDDWVKDNSLAEINNIISLNDADVLVFGADAPNETPWVAKQKSLKKYLRVKFEGIINLEEDVIFNTNVYAWNKIYKKSLIDEYQISFPENVQYEDFPFFYLYFALAKKAYYSKEKFYNYFQRAASNMAQTAKGNYDLIRQHLDCLKYLYFEFKKHDIDSGYFAKIFLSTLEAGLRCCDKKQKMQYLKDAEALYKELNLSNHGILLLSQLGNKEFDKIINRVVREYKTKLFGLIPLKVVTTTRDKIKMYLFNKLLVVSVKIEVE